MNAARMLSCAPIRLAALTLAGALATTAAADVITVTNEGPWGTTILSDLIIWDASGKQEVIKKPGFDAAGAADDESLEIGESRVFVTDLKVAKYFVSFKADSPGIKMEAEWKSGVSVAIVTFCSAMMSPAGEPVHCAVTDPSGAAMVLPPGAPLFVENGLSPQAPGIFFGRAADFAAGEIIDPYTGPVEVVVSGVTVAIESSCRGDLTGDGLLDFFDFLAFQDLFAAGDPRADFDGDGLLTFFDFLAFQNEFAAGCP